MRSIPNAENVVRLFSQLIPGTDERLLHVWVSELEEQVPHLLEVLHSRSGELPYTARAGDAMGLLYYLLVRVIQPKCILETGVASGFSSAVILLALEANGIGELISIDYPAYAETLRQIRFDLTHYPWGLNRSSVKRLARYVIGRKPFIPKGRNAGWIVPEGLRERWRLLEGMSQAHLPHINSTPEIFIHDSDHSAVNMRYELDWAAQNVRPGGVVLCDNIELSDAWTEFVKANRPPVNRVLFEGRLGFAVLQTGKHS